MKIGNRTFGAFVALVVLVVLAVVFAVPTTPASGAPAQQNRFSYRVQVRANATEPALWVRQNGSGVVLQIDAVPTNTGTPGVKGTPYSVLKVANSGAVTLPGALTVGSIVGSTSNDLDGGSLTLDPIGSTLLQATANYQPILTLGGTPTAAAFSVKSSDGTPVAVFRGGAGGIQLLGGPIAVGTSVPLAGVASTAIAPVGLLQPVSMATAGTVPITIPSAGQMTCIWNTGTEVVTIADTGNQVLSASAALGQYDSLCGVSDGTRFIEVSRSNN